MTGEREERGQRERRGEKQGKREIGMERKKAEKERESKRNGGRGVGKKQKERRKDERGTEEGGHLPFHHRHTGPPLLIHLCSESQIEHLEQFHKCLILVITQDNRDLPKLYVQVEPWTIADPQWSLGTVAQELCLATDRLNDVLLGMSEGRYRAGSHGLLPGTYCCLL